MWSACKIDDSSIDHIIERDDDMIALPRKRWWHDSST